MIFINLEINWSFQSYKVEMILGIMRVIKLLRSSEIR